GEKVSPRFHKRGYAVPGALRRRERGEELLQPRCDGGEAERLPCPGLGCFDSIAPCGVVAQQRSDIRTIAERNLIHRTIAADAWHPAQQRVARDLPRHGARVELEDRAALRHLAQV